MKRPFSITSPLMSGNLNLKKLTAILAISTFIFLSAVTGVLVDVYLYAEKPVNTDPLEKIVVITPGQGFQALSKQLYKAGIIEHPVKFEWFSRLKGYDKKIKAGEYLLSFSMSPHKILEVIVSGKVRLHRITIPEGYHLRQIARALAEAGFGTENDFLKAATDPIRVNEYGIDAKTFEGYLFPDTYLFPRDATPEMVVSAMVKRFWSVMKPEWEDRAGALGFSIHQVITLASIIEKETGAAHERPLISSVFHNRLKRKMRLESDPTVIYGIKGYDGNIKRKHLAERTPYNTYQIKGLPPGPIANTGIESIKAALYPADTRLLYFVSKRDNTHQFSTNVKDHNRAVRKYQLRR